MRLRQLVVFGSFLCVAQGGGSDAESVERLTQLKAELETYVSNPSMLRKASNLFVKDIVPLAQHLYEGFMEKFFVNGLVDEACSTKLAEILADLVKHRSGISWACGWSNADDLLHYVEIRSGYLRLNKIKEGVSNLSQLPIVTSKVTPDQAKALYQSLVAKDDLEYHIFLVSLLALPNRPVSARLPPPLHNVAIVDKLTMDFEGRTTEAYTRFLTTLMELCEAFDEVTDVDVFNYIYTRLLKNWEFILDLPQELYTQLIDKMLSDMLTVIPAQACALLRKASSITSGLLSAQNTRSEAKYSSLQRNGASLEQTKSSLASRAAIFANKLVANTRQRVVLQKDLFLPYENYSPYTPFHKAIGWSASFTTGIENILVFQALLMQDPNSIASTLRNIDALYRQLHENLEALAKKPKYLISYRQLLITGRTLLFYHGLAGEYLSVAQRQKLGLSSLD